MTRPNESRPAAGAPRRLLAALAAALCVVALVPADARAAGAPRLSAFASCGQLGAYARGHALRMLEARPAWGRPVPVMPVAGGEVQRERAAAAPDFSRTNVQEAGVDEPDAIKLDATRMFTAVDGTLRAIDLRGRAPRVAGRLALPGDEHELLLHGDRVIVIASGGGESDTVRLLEVDARDPAAMRIVRAIAVEGWHLSARLNGSIARVAISSPEPDVYSEAAVRRARWLPRARFHHRPTGRRATRALTACSRVRRPSEFAGLGMLTVLTFDLDRGLIPVDSDAVMTGGDTVYGSRDGLYVATERWLDPATPPDEIPSDSATLVHRFGGGDRPVTTYEGTAAVPGYLLNQFSLSEHAGHLRVATTTEPPWTPGAPDRDSESLVTVLAPRAGGLARIGRVAGLGRGERIYAVRFLGDVGFVVTFRETDPLYALDLADPRRPRVAGELKIPGYSAYLHPVGDDLLLGIGQDASARGEVRGTQVSLFDVSDLRRPTRIAHRTLGARSYSEVEEDHRAFTFWPATGLAVLPLTVLSADGDAEEFGFAGAVGLRVAGRRLTEVARFEQAGGVTRSALHGGRLYTVSESGLRVADADTLRPEGWLAFPVSRGR